MPDDTNGQEPSPAGEPTPDLNGATAAERELRHTQELLREVRRQRDELERQVAAQQRQIEANAEERADLHRLLAAAQQHGPAFPHDPPDLWEAQPSPLEDTTGWREGKRGLGASLTLTGIAALAAGVLLHFALQQRIIVSAAHLGYIIGLIGLLTFLLGLLLVF